MTDLPLFKGPEPFALVAEDAIDGERIQREREQKERDVTSCDKQQLKLKGTSHEEIDN